MRARLVVTGFSAVLLVANVGFGPTIAHGRPLPTASVAAGSVSYSLAASIALPGQGEELAVDPVLHRAWVSDGHGVVTEIDTTTNTLVRQVQQPDEGGGWVAVDPRKQLAYVTTGFNVDAVSVINENTGEMTMVDLPAQPGAIVTDPAAGLYYVLCGRALDVLDSSSNQILRSIDLSAAAPSAHQMAIDTAREKIYITDIDNGVVVLNLKTDKISATLPVDSPDGVAVDHHTHTVYTTSFYGDTVTATNPNRATLLASVPVGMQPASVAVDAGARTAYTANYGDNTFSAVNEDTATLIAAVPVPDQEPVSIAVDTSSHEVYVLTQGGGTVDVYNRIKH